MERSNSGGFLSAAFDDVNNHGEFLMIDDDDDHAGVWGTGEELEVPLNDVPAPVSVSSKSMRPNMGNLRPPSEAPTTEPVSSDSTREETLESSEALEPVRFERKKKSAMKKSGCLNEEIPICLKKRSYIALPKPDTKMIHSQSMASFFPPLEEEDDAPKIKRNVSFSSISMREYPLTLGDNPSVSRGPPTTLDWQFEEKDEMCLESYEENRGPRRNRRQMVLNQYKRTAILSDGGHTATEMELAERAAEKTKKQRNATISMMPFEKVEDMLQSAKRKAKRAVGGMKKSSSSGSLSASA